MTSRGKLLAALALSLCACRVVVAEAGPDGSVCASGVPCAHACCAKGQKCVAGACATCGCGTRQCGTDACGISCGTCAAGACNALGQCGVSPLCVGVVCRAGESCDILDGACKCTGAFGTQGSCPAGQVCSASGHCALVPDPCGTKSCTGTTPKCVNSGGVAVCVCTATSCGSCNTCNLASGTCSAQVCKCDGVVCNAGEPCNPANGACECTSTSCSGFGKSCNPITKRCMWVDGCNCTSDEWCDTSRSTDCATDNCCAKICNDPAGCLPSEVCVLDPADAGFAHTGTCHNQTCHGAQCQPGQVCFDLSKISGDPVPNEVCTCTPEISSFGQPFTHDSCGPGLVCGMDIENVQPSTCRLPGELEECETTPGCGIPKGCQVADGGMPTCQLDCVGGFISGGKRVNLCLRPCKTGAVADTKKCGLPWTYCDGPNLGYHCWFNDCADPTCSSTPTGCTEAGERAKLFKGCKATTGFDGTCMLINYSDGDLGVCFQAGSATSQCDPNALRASSGINTTMCKVGSWCAAVMPDPANPGKEIGLCQKLCNAATGASPNPVLPCADATDTCVFCDEQGYCFDSSWPSPDGTESSAAVTGMGYCMKSCDPAGSVACPVDRLPAPYTEQQGCMPKRDLAGGGFCAEITPNAGALGASCAPNSAPDLRSSCGDRLFCDPNTSTCSDWCRSADCPDATAVCAECSVASCCSPTCNAGHCGTQNGCGGVCGCAANQKCDASSGTCQACTPSCSAGSCNVDDGCGHPCACSPGQHCAGTTCAAGCAPNCMNKRCGDDSCGGSCGACGGGEICATRDTGLHCTPMDPVAPTATLELCRP